MNGIVVLEFVFHFCMVASSWLISVLACTNLLGRHPKWIRILRFRNLELKTASNSSPKKVKKIWISQIQRFLSPLVRAKVCSQSTAGPASPHAPKSCSLLLWTTPSLNAAALPACSWTSLFGNCWGAILVYCFVSKLLQCSECICSLLDWLLSNTSLLDWAMPVSSAV